jgi:hypothetical protein
MMLRAALAGTLAALAVPAGVMAQTKPPIAQYWVDVATQNMSIPGMEGVPAGMIPGMPGGGGPQRALNLYLYSTQKQPPAPEATHDIPPGQNMGPTLPLVLPRVERGPAVERDVPENFEKPKARMLVYWGCGEAVRAGQPRVADTSTMSPQQFGQALSGRVPPRGGSPYGQNRAVWPNERDSKQVPASSSLVGDHLVKGNYSPEIRFRVGGTQDFMAPLALTSRGGLTDAVQLAWQPVPTAQGYFLMAMAHREKRGETVIWTSSEVQDSGFALMNYLPNDFVRRMIQEKVILPASASNCAIPKGIFEGAEGVSVQAIAYGEELNLAHPPRPADPKAPWEPLWTVKVRVKSTGMTMLGMGDEDESPRRGRRSGAAPSQPQPQPSSPGPAQTPPAESPTGEAVRQLRGIFGF